MASAYLDPEVLNKNPNFKKLMQDLFEKLKIKAMLHEDQIKHAKEELQKEKNSFFKQKLLYDCIKEIIVADKMFHLSEKDVSLLKSTLTKLEVANYLSNPNLSSLAELIQVKFQKEEKWKDDLILEIETKIKDKEDALVKFYLKDKEGSDFTELIKVIRANLEQLEANKERKRELDELKGKIMIDYSEAMMSGLEHLKKQIELLTAKARTDKIETEYFTNKCKALLHKVKFLELSLLHETYSSEVVVAHKILKEKLSSKRKELEKELNSASSSLKSYQELGPEFQTLVSEYHKLKADLENKKWAHDQFTNMSHS